MDSEGRDEKGRFTPGNPGGPGRPKGSLSLLTLIKHKLDEIPDGWEQTIAERLIEEYILGVLEKQDGTGVRDLVDRIDGKSVQKFQVENEKIAEFVDLYRGLKDAVVKKAGGDTGDGTPAESEDPDS